MEICTEDAQQLMDHLMANPHVHSPSKLESPLPGRTCLRLVECGAGLDIVANSYNVSDDTDDWL